MLCFYSLGYSSYSPSSYYGPGKVIVCVCTGKGLDRPDTYMHAHMRMLHNLSQDVVIQNNAHTYMYIVTCRSIVIEVCTDNCHVHRFYLMHTLIHSTL